MSALSDPVEPDAQEVYGSSGGGWIGRAGSFQQTSGAMLARTRSIFGVVPANEPVKKSSQFPANCDSLEMLGSDGF